MSYVRTPRARGAESEAPPVNWRWRVRGFSRAGKKKKKNRIARSGKSSGFAGESGPSLDSTRSAPGKLDPRLAGGGRPGRPSPRGVIADVDDVGPASWRAKGSRSAGPTAGVGA